MHAQVVQIWLVKSEKVEVQGTYAKIKPYIKKGYRISYENNGYYVLTKPSKLNVELQSEGGASSVFNMKYDILKRYGKQRLTTNVYDCFLEEVKSGKIQFEYNPDDNTYSMR